MQIDLLRAWRHTIRYWVIVKVILLLESMSRLRIVIHEGGQELQLRMCLLISYAVKLTFKTWVVRPSYV